ncbi:MAG: GntR family transcriptional regulator [Segniliparus sp.]|uniref:GntR family transcriptional regulator n=1 Tax=Segniliparus sp. TaxID=2804064 RepID=UPI003F3FBED8
MKARTHSGPSVGRIPKPVLYTIQVVGARHRRRRRLNGKAGAVYEALRARITSGDLVAGQRLDEEAVAKAMGVSRTPVREALARIAVEGLAEQGARRQMVVVDIRARQHEVLLLRVALETIAAREACADATESDLDQLRVNVVRQRRAAAVCDHERFLTLDEEFHRRMAAAAHLPLLSQFLEQLGGFVHLLRLGMPTSAQHMALVADEHSKLVDLLERKETQLLPEALEKHIAALERPDGGV